MTEATKVKVFDYSVHSSKDYWLLITKPEIEQFKSSCSPRTAAHVVQSLRGLLEWHAEENRIESKKDRASHYFPKCPEMRWVEDIADSAKHRGLSRK